MKYIRTITIDISKKIYETIETKSKDTARYLLFKLLDNGVPLDLTGKIVRAYSSSKKLNDLAIVDAKDGLCELKLTTGFLSDGLNQAELTIYEGLDTLSNMPFYINNIACLRDDAAIEATNEFSALTIALDKVEQLDKNLNNASTDLEKKYTTRLTSLESQLEDNALNSIETDASLTKLNSVLDGNLVVDRVQGRTLVNIITAKNITLTKPSDRTKTIALNQNLKFNTNYTIIINVKSQSNFISGYSVQKVGNISSELLFSKDYNHAAKIIKIFNTGTDSNINRLYFYINSDELDGATVTFENISILEGDYTQNPPAYFDGMKSVAEDNQNKIEISTCGNNLWDIEATKKYISTYDTSVVYLIDDGKNVVEFDESLYLNSKLLQGSFLPNTQYCFSATAKKIGGSSFYIVIYYTDGTLDKLLFATDTTKYIKSTKVSAVGKSISHICFSYGAKGYKTRLSLDDLQINIGNTLLPYEPYRTDKSEILLENSLREWDYLDKLGYHVLSGVRSYQSGDETNVNCITDKTNTVYKLSQEILKPLNSPLILKAFKDGYFGINSGAINPVVSLRFPTNIGERVTGVEESTIYLRNRYYECLKVQLQLLAKNIELETNKQNKTDSTLTTTSKEVVGAINENKDALNTNSEDITNLKKDATVTPFPFDTVFTNNSAYSQYVKKNGLVVLIVDVKKKDGSALGTDWVKIGKLPTGLIPTNSIDGYAMTYPTQEATALRVLDTGDVFVLVKTADQKYAYGSVTYYAKGGTI